MAAAVGSAAAAATLRQGPDAGPAAAPAGEAAWVPDRVLVRFKPTAGGLATAAAQQTKPLPGLEPSSVISGGGEPALGGGGPMASAAAAGPTTPTAGAAEGPVMLFDVVDGTPADEKAAQLQANKSAAAAARFDPC